MPLSFTAFPPKELHHVRRTVLVTGAAGHIGSYFAEHSAARYSLRLMVRGDEDRARIDALKKCGEVVHADLGDLPRLKEICRGIDTVVHLAADPNPSSTWQELLPTNIIGTYNMMVAARSAGCRRVVYASSIHTVTGYARDIQPKTSEPVNPGDIYGVTKCFGEALGRYMAEQENLSVIALRFGAFQPVETAHDAQKGIKLLDMFVSRRDVNQIIERSIDVENLRFGIFFGVSDNLYKRYDISDARELLGYAPQDDVFALQPDLAKIKLKGNILEANRHDGEQKSGIRNDV
jgi:dTDP-4-dehydrorhamnose reductase